jgi:hypothetical protein
MSWSFSAHSSPGSAASPPAAAPTSTRLAKLRRLSTIQTSTIVVPKAVVASPAPVNAGTSEPRGSNRLARLRRLSVVAGKTSEQAAAPPRPSAPSSPAVSERTRLTAQDTVETSGSTSKLFARSYSDTSDDNSPSSNNVRSATNPPQRRAPSYSVDDLDDELADLEAELALEAELGEHLLLRSYSCLLRTSHLTLATVTLLLLTFICFGAFEYAPNVQNWKPSLTH